MTADDPCPDCGGSTFWFGPARDWACSLCEKVCRHDSAPAFLAKQPSIADQQTAARAIAATSGSVRETIRRANAWREKAPATPVLEMRHG